MRTAAAILSFAGAAYCLDALLATLGHVDSADQSVRRTLLGLASAGCLALVYRFLEGSRAADNRALDERASSTE